MTAITTTAKQMSPYMPRPKEKTLSEGRMRYVTTNEYLQEQN
jgi:hypothetical protein